MQKRQLLPVEYRHVDYLESSGTQYIDFYPDSYAPEITNNLCVFIDFVLVSTQSGSESGFFGGKPRTGTSTNAPTLFVNNTSCGLNSWCDSGSTFYGTRITIGERYKVTNYWYVQSGRKMILDGDEKTGKQLNVNMSRAVSRQYTIFKDGPRPVSDGSTSLSYMRIYSAAISIDGQTVRNVIPCVRKSDSKPGMYDTVSKTFYTNAGTGEFIVPA